jgi:hypothetical protein
MTIEILALGVMMGVAGYIVVPWVQYIKAKTDALNSQTRVYRMEHRLDRNS